MAYSYDLSEKEVEVLHKLHECNHNQQSIKQLVEQWSGDVCYVVAITNLRELDLVYTAIYGKVITEVGLSIRGEAWAIENPENAPA